MTCRNAFVDNSRLTDRGHTIDTTEASQLSSVKSSTAPGRLGSAFLREREVIEIEEFGRVGRNVSVQRASIPSIYLYHSEAFF